MTTRKKIIAMISASIAAAALLMRVRPNPVVRLVAELGYAPAQHKVGHEYQYGYPQDDSTAIMWYRKAADKGLAEAQFDLGDMYWLGNGVAKDYSEAIAWYRKAGEQGLEEAQNRLGDMYSDQQGVKTDGQEALAWYSKAADRGSVNALVGIGNMYSEGHGVEKDVRKAIPWYRAAADRGDADAEYYLGEIYSGGQQIAKDSRQAIAWYRKAAEHNDCLRASSCSDAQIKLGRIYFSGDGVVQDFSQAATWWRKAAELGSGPGQLFLGACYEYGRGVAEDKSEAAKLYRQAEDAYDLTELGKSLVKSHLTGIEAASAQTGTKQAEADPLADIPPAKANNPQMPMKQTAATLNSISRDEMQRMIDLAATKATSNVLAIRSAKAEAQKPVAITYHSDVDIPKFKNAENPNNYAVVVGVEKYTNDLPEAQFAERDAQAVKDNLIALGYPARNIKFLTGNRASLSALSAYLEDWLPQNTRAESRVFFYFSGHGAPDLTTNQAYLVPSDGDPSFLNKTAYPLKKLYADLNALKARQIIVALDSCFSGSGGRSVMAEGARPLVMKTDTAVPPDGRILLFAAASSKEIASTLKNQGHGIFTYYFLKGLGGAAKDPSGEVTPRGLYDYLKPKVQDAASLQNHAQTPVMEGATTGAIAQPE